LIEYSHIPERKNELNLKIQEAEFLRENTRNTLRVPKYSDTLQNRTLKDSVYEAVQKIFDEYQVHLDYYYGQLEELDRHELHMFEALKFLTPMEYKIIDLYYFKRYKWESVATKAHYSERQCRNIRDMAIGKLTFNYPRLME